MGKKRVAKVAGKGVDQGLKSRSISRTPKRNIIEGTLHIHATYNNTTGLWADIAGNTIMWASAGALGFSGAKRGTPFAAAKVGELLAEKAGLMGMKEANVVVRGVGAGRESLLRAFASKGIAINRIADETPVPHNGPRPPKARRV